MPKRRQPFDDLIQAVQRSPHDESPTQPVPQSADDHGHQWRQDQVEVFGILLPVAGEHARKWEEDVITQPV